MSKKKNAQQAEVPQAERAYWAQRQWEAEAQAQAQAKAVEEAAPAPAPVPTETVPATPSGKRYLIVTKNPVTTKIFGVKIEQGVGVLDETTLDPKLGHTMADVVLELRQREGYELRDLTGEDPFSAIRAIRDEQAAREAKEEAAINLLRDPNLAAKVKEALGVR